jgi:hypothetical protein
MTENPPKLFCLTHIGRQEPSFNGDIGEFRLNFVICGSTQLSMSRPELNNQPSLLFLKLLFMVLSAVCNHTSICFKRNKVKRPFEYRKRHKKGAKKFKSLKIRAAPTRNCSFLFMRGVSTNADNHET